MAKPTKLEEIKLPNDDCGVFAWYDKLDGYYLLDMLQTHKHPSVIARSYLAAFQQDRKLQYKRYELHMLGTVNEKTGDLVRCPEPLLLNPLEVWSEKPFNPDEAVKEL